jgi:hypothetical protein
MLLVTAASRRKIVKENQVQGLAVFIQGLNVLDWCLAARFPALTG